MFPADEEGRTAGTGSAFDLARLGRAGWVELRDGLAAARVAALVVRTPRAASGPWSALRDVLRGAGAPPGSSLEALVREASRHEVAGVLSELMPSVAPQLAGAIARQKRHHALLELATEQVAAALSPSGLDARVVLLKGSASAVHVYADPWQRARRDVDLLVLPEDFAEVRTALWNAGWRDAIVRELGGPPGAGRTFGMRLSVGPALIHLDLHRNLVTRPWCGFVGPAFRRRFLEASVAGRAALPVTSAEHTLLHTVAHLVHSGFSAAPKGLVDLGRLASIADGDVVTRDASAFGLRTASWALLRVVRRWFGAAAPWDIEVLAPRSRARRLLLGRLLAGEGPSPLLADIERRTLVQGLPRLVMDGAGDGPWS